jgi:hypothetical protein
MGEALSKRELEIAETSAVFGPGTIEAVNGTDLLVMWLEHLLVLSMLQHRSGTWTWGRFVVVHPAGNTDFADACARYRALLVDEATFSAVTVEDLLDSGALPAPTVATFRDRYAHGSADRSADGGYRVAGRDDEEAQPDGDV